MFHVTLKENLPSILKQGLVPQTGPRAELLGESTDGIYLFKTREDAETALGSWLGEEFENEELVLLEVNVPPDAKLIPTTADYEIVVASPIPPQFIKALPDQI
jgi:hypothetical protein